jgi:hypothetical protein
MRNHEYHWSKIVIGSSLSALKHAHDSDCYFILNCSPKIFFLDKDNDSYVIDMWNEMSHELSMKGKLPLGDAVKKIQVTPEENKLNVFIGSSKKINIFFEELQIFDNENIFGIEINKKLEGYRVLDWFRVRAGAKHDYDCLLDKESCLANKIHFYISDRIDGGKSRNLKDLVSESLLTKEMLHDINYSDSIVRLKTIDMMKKNGIGEMTGVDIELEKREVFPLKTILSEEYKNIIIGGK